MSFNPQMNRKNGGKGIPGTTPLVAIALIDMAVSIVWKEENPACGNLERFDLFFFVPLHLYANTNTHTATAHEDNTEGLQHPSGSHHPGQPQEQDDAKDVLQTGQVNAHHRPHLR